MDAVVDALKNFDVKSHKLNFMVISDGSIYDTRLINMTTGQPIENCSRLEIRIDAKTGENSLRAEFVNPQMKMCFHTSMDTTRYVQEFHEAFGHPVKETPDLSDKAIIELRRALIQEELNEFSEAADLGSKVDVFDALLDLQYVLDGAFIALGFHNIREEGFRRVHESNMSKLGADGKPVVREDGKILKGPHYKKVDLTDLVA